MKDRTTFRGESIDKNTAFQYARGMVRMLHWVESFPNLPFVWMRIRHVHSEEYRICHACDKKLSVGRIVRLTIPEKKIFCCGDCHKKGYGVVGDFTAIPHAT